jgi:hypothetical protein
MKKKAMILALLLCFSPCLAIGSTILETTAFITGVEGDVYPFEASVGPYTYEATLTDLSSDPLGFKYLYLSITTASDVLIPFTSVTDSGSFTFDVTPDESYFANVFGRGTGRTKTGLYGLKVSTVPIPSAFLLLASGIIGLIGVRRRVNRP